MKDLFVYHRGKKLRCGYTTGSCATGAAKAAALMLEHQKILDKVEISTPADIPLTLDLYNQEFNDRQSSCGVIKDAGDDHDVTDGAEVRASVKKRADGKIVISGGEGIGKISKPGFWGEVGESAINPVPRKMIKDELSKIGSSGWDVLITVPGGEEIAQKTLNDKLGIIGGISIIGTTGIVEPMSLEAMKQTIYLEIDDIEKSGSKEILLILGNYGERVAKELGYEYPTVKISNFIGDAVLYCKNKDFKKVFLIGHIGKLSKLSIGAFYTHSSACDLRMEAFVYYLALEGAPQQLIHQISECTDSEEALELIEQNNLGNIVTKMREGCLNRIRRYVKDPNFNIEIIIYSLQKGILD